MPDVPDTAPVPPDRRRRRRALRAATWLLALAVVAVVGLLVGQRSLLYHPDRTIPPPAADVLDRGQDVVVRTDDGLDLAAWYVPARGCRSTVLLLHGNGGSRWHRASLARGVVDRGFGVLVLDYRGYGGNPGRPTEDGLARDARAARAFLLDDGVPDDALVHLGESLGTGVAARLTDEHPPAALVLRSPFTSMADVVRSGYGLRLGPLLLDRYDVVGPLGDVTVPVAVVHGDDDDVVPADLSREVARTAREAGVPVVEVEVPGAGHNDAALAEGPELLDALVEVATLGGAPPCDP